MFAYPICSVTLLTTATINNLTHGFNLSFVRNSRSTSHKRVRFFLYKYIQKTKILTSAIMSFIPSAIFVKALGSFVSSFFPVSKTSSFSVAGAGPLFLKTFGLLGVFFQ